MKLVAVFALSGAKTLSVASKIFERQNVAPTTEVYLVPKNQFEMSVAYLGVVLRNNSFCSFLKLSKVFTPDAHR